MVFQISCYTNTLENDYTLYKLDKNYTSKKDKFIKIEDESSIPKDRYYLLAMN